MAPDCEPREVSRGRSIAALRDSYAPLLKRSGATVVLLQSWGYCKDAKRSEQLGDFEAMTHKLAMGCAEYATVLKQAGVPALCAPVGTGFARNPHTIIAGRLRCILLRTPAISLLTGVRRADAGLWERCYQRDGFHPKALGSFLAAAHLAAVILGHRWGAQPVRTLRLPRHNP